MICVAAELLVRVTPRLGNSRILRRQASDRTSQPAGVKMPWVGVRRSRSSHAVTLDVGGQTQRATPGETPAPSTHQRHRARPELLLVPRRTTFGFKALTKGFSLKRVLPASSRIIHETVSSWDVDNHPCAHWPLHNTCQTPCGCPKACCAKQCIRDNRTSSAECAYYISRISRSTVEGHQRPPSPLPAYPVAQPVARVKHVSSKRTTR